MPPGGGTPPPFPPFDSKAQQRVYREQQKAAWRAQREAWKAQTQVWKANYINTYGPRVPSVVGPVLLITFGTIALLVAMGRLNAGDFFGWYGHWWPLMLIAAGLVMLAEWAIDLRRQKPVRRSSGFFGILFLIGILGVFAGGWNHMDRWFDENGDHDLGDFFNGIDHNEHNFDSQVFTAALPPNANLTVENPHGDVSISVSDGAAIEVIAHEVAYGGTDSDAKKIFDAEAPHLTVNGSSVLVKSDSNPHGRINLSITVPKSTQVTVNAEKGDVTAAGLGAGIHINAHGDVQLSEISGQVGLHSSGGKHDFSAHQINGDINADGEINDLTLSEITGKVNQTGEIQGDVQIEKVTGTLHLHTSVTDLEVAELPGDMNLNADNLRVTEAKGQVRVVTRSKDVDLSGIAGGSYVEDRDGRISVAPAGNYPVEAKNSKGDVEVTLPPNASASVQANTRNGDIVSDFAMPRIIEANAAKAVTFRIGAGAAMLTLSAENGDVRIKKGDEVETSSATPAEPHLKASKTKIAQPVTQ